MISNSLREFTRFVAEKLGHPEIGDDEIDQILFSWGSQPEPFIVEKLEG